MAKDMAHRPGLDHKIWQIAWPAILSNISVPLLGLVDTAILGHLESTRYLGAVAIGASILSFLYWGFGFLRMGTTGLVARAAGADDRARELTVFLQSGILAVVLALVVILSHPLWLQLGIVLMAPGPELAPLTRSYVSIRVFSAPAVLVTYAIVGWFIGRQNTRWPMVIAILTNLLNIGLDVLFIIVLDMKSDGAAYATLVSEYVGCAVAVVAVIRQLDWRPLAGIREFLFRFSAYTELLESNRYLFIRTMCLLFSFAFFTAMSNRLGETTLAANTIMLQLMMLAAYGLDGFAYAAEGLSGNAAGAGDMSRFHLAVRSCWRWSLLTATLISGIYALGAPLIFPLFTPHATVLVQLQIFLPWLVLLPLAAAPSYLLDGVFIGAARTRYMMHSMLFCLIAIYLPLWYLLQGMGNNGLWLSFTVFNAARGATLAWCFYYLDKRGMWLD
jgi:MATE family multidrug resistance protein